MLYGSFQKPSVVKIEDEGTTISHISGVKKFHRRRNHWPWSLGQVYMLSQPRLGKWVISKIHPDSFLSLCAFAFPLLKENIHLLLWFCGESLIYKSHKELLEYAFEDECLGVKAASCWDTCWWNNSCTERRWNFFLKLGFCFMEYSSHLRLCFALCSCLAANPFWNTIGLLGL